MNRSTFFKTLFAGAAAAPAIAKVLAEELKEADSVYDTTDCLDEFGWHQYKISRPVLESHPYRGILFYPDTKPARFNS